MLLGRVSERRAIGRLLADARVGTSGVLALVGEPGIGKTALLSDAADRATAMRVLRARGIESETEVPFAGLLELVRPALPALSRLPSPQAEALESALALRPGPARERFAVGAATLSLLAAYADEQPLLLIVDDAHWLDGASAEALLFAIRRLVADPIAVLLAARADEPSFLDGAGLPTLSLAGLDRATARELLAGHAAEPISPELAERLYGATAGNPLALLELALETPALVTDPAVPVATSISRAFVRRTGPLSERARRALVLAAASDSGDLVVLERAANALHLDTGDLEDAERSGLVSIVAGRLEFRHPLARAAVYADAPPEERRAAHGALAGTMPDRDADSRAWHLALAAVGLDEPASAALEASALRARDRSAFAAAVSAFERAARLTEVGGRRAGLLLEAADAAALSGAGPRALALLEEATPLAVGTVHAPRIDYLRGRIVMRRGPLAEAIEIVSDAAERIAAEDPAQAIVMFAEVVHAAFYAGDARRMRLAADRAVQLAAGRPSFFSEIASGMAAVYDGGGDAEGIRRAVEILQASDELHDDPRLLVWAAMGVLWLREAETGHALIERAGAKARERAAIGALPSVLHHHAREHWGAGRLREASAGYDEAIALARETGQRIDLAAALAGLAWVEARQGREADCLAHAAEGRALCAELGLWGYDLWNLAALGELELGLGRAEQAVELFEAQQAALLRRGIADVDLSPAPELVDAYLRLGRIDDAKAAAAAYAAAATVKGQPWALARAARSAGLVENEPAPHFERALELHARTPDIFESARTHLAYGAVLRRARERLSAREHLRVALETMETIGADPWAEQARMELAATGETARRRDASTLDQLTPQELQVALLLAEGRTTREAAAALFLSPKTVEYHLRHVYRKLQIASRADLAAAFSR